MFITQKGNIFNIGYTIGNPSINGWAYSTLEGQMYATIIWIVQNNNDAISHIYNSKKWGYTNGLTEYTLQLDSSANGLAFRLINSSSLNSNIYAYIGILYNFSNNKFVLYYHDTKNNIYKTCEINPS